ncbi:cupin domain-containing protein [Litorivivens sp.]|uniref:cupin domain-containing protein n=2 Tax=Litorivivens sp. TaxID=2020868 RepID=UPI00356951A6
MDKHTLIEKLQLSPHPEGGFFRRTYESSHTHLGRRLMSSIFYLLTDDQPTGHLHRNRSDIVHYWQGGGSLLYTLLTPEGKLLQITLGPDVPSGEQLQLTVPGGFWKGSQLLCGDYALISEAVCPGFDFDDHEMASADEMQQRYPEHWPSLKALCQT